MVTAASFLLVWHPSPGGWDSFVSGWKGLLQLGFPNVDLLLVDRRCRGGGSRHSSQPSTVWRKLNDEPRYMATVAHFAVLLLVACAGTACGNDDSGARQADGLGEIAWSPLVTQADGEVRACSGAGPLISPPSCNPGFRVQDLNLADVEGAQASESWHLLRRRPLYGSDSARGFRRARAAGRRL